jgi:penicillin amidase
MMKKIITIILIVILVIVIGLYVYLRSFVPDYNEEIAAPGLKNAVTIERNRYAVPTIVAQNDEDLYFAWGYVNAQDRLFQMEFTRRVAQGRISEFAGESALTKDIFLRAVGFYDIAVRGMEKLDPVFKKYLQRYVDGINYYLDTHGTNLYMKLLGFKKETWKPADAASVGVMLAWSLAYNMKHELLYHKIARKIGKERCIELLNFIPPETPTIIDDKVGGYASDKEFVARLRDLGWLLGCRSASNNWVLAPEKNSHDGAILASDMHVHSSKLPNDFYFVHVKAGDYEAAGAQVLGLPFIVTGYNQYCAWANTNYGADVVDLFKENINWDSKAYRHMGVEYPLAEKEMEFRIKGRDPVKKIIYYAGRKPILNDVFPDIGFDISLDWAGFDDMNVEGFFHINRARNYEDFVAAAKKIRITPQNMVYADEKGNIAYRVIGSIPLRNKGTGNFPADGEEARLNWRGNVPDEKYPMAKNPPRGFIATANGKEMRDFPYDVNPVFAPGYRYENIAGMLRDKNRIEVEYVKKMQTDTHTMLANKLLPIIKQFVIPGDNERMKKAYNMVLEWDGENRKNAVAPSIYNTFYVRFFYQTFKDEIGPDLVTEFIGERYISMERFFELVKNKSHFFDDVSTAEKETISDIATRAFKEVLDILEKYSGSSDIDSWEWGKFHKIKFDHILGKSALLRPFVNYGPFPFEGDSETNNRGRFLGVEPPFIAESASAPRMIVKFDPKPKCYMMLITGENEYFMSKHNTDMTDAWLRHEYFCLEEEPAVYRATINPK